MAMKLLMLAFGIVAAAFTGSTESQAQSTFPKQPIKLIYPFGAGSAMDTSWRHAAAIAGKILGQPVVIENQPGASGQIGFRAMAAAKPDGYTLGVPSNSVLVTQPLYDLAWTIKPGVNYEPVIFGVSAEQYLFANANVPYNDVAGLIAYAKANPGKVNFANTGVGTTAHLGAEALAAAAGIDVTHISYNGMAPALPDLLSGTVDLLFASGFFQEHADSGAMKVIGNSGRTRGKQFPNAPLLSETPGLEGFSIAAWTGLVAPMGTPPEVIERLREAFKKTLDSPEFLSQAEKIGQNVETLGPVEFKAMILRETDILRPIVKAAGLKK
ncbi:putative Tripartite-type tricarboxylate transporter receptor subunit TctC [Hyphomicrobiales bacterium]|nr:putative Tripartite-type tricarboxylate transporter receptor subunit TctC [Hyphomicrobiales bacterium]CAH1692079.1 putative Tripartite tricarboxylate transporter substrate binding protein [Hyphomicrobiales bacterium]